MTFNLEVLADATIVEVTSSDPIAPVQRGDELLIIHDVEDDPITERQNIPEGVRLIAAGEPECCSGTGQHHRRYTHRDGEVTTPF